MSLRVFLAVAVLGVACNRQPEAPAKTPALTQAAPVDPFVDRIDKARIQGADTAKVWLVIASDFQCPYCKGFHDDTYKRIIKDYVVPGKVRVAFLNHPMSFHQFAIPSAEAALCAGAQNRFWEMHDALFMTQDKWTTVADPQPSFTSLAQSLKLNMDDWNKCMATHATRKMVDGDLFRSKQGGVKGTPSFFIANKFTIEGAQPYAVFRDSLDAAIARAGGGQKP